jgi:hypothetical protein
MGRASSQRFPKRSSSSNAPSDDGPFIGRDDLDLREKAIGCSSGR